MSKSEKRLRSEEKELLKLRAQTEDLQKKAEVAKTELDAVKVSFGRQAIAGDDLGKLSGELSLKRIAVEILEQGLQELASQITAQERAVSLAANACYQDECTSLVDAVVKDYIGLIEEFARMQVVVHKNLIRTQRVQSLRTDHKLTNVLHAIDFECVASDLQSAQSQLEREIRVQEASKIPNAALRGGYLDEKRIKKTLGSAVRDWAASEVSK